MTDKERLENMCPIVFDLDGNLLLKSEDYCWLMEQAEKSIKYRELLWDIANLAYYKEQDAEYYEGLLKRVMLFARNALEG